MYLHCSNQLGRYQQQRTEIRRKLVGKENHHCTILPPQIQRKSYAKQIRLFRPTSELTINVLKVIRN